MKQLNSATGADEMVKTSNNGPESIAKLKLCEKYTFFDDKDVKTYYFKKRTLSPSEFADYVRHLNMIQRILAMSLEDRHSKDKIAGRIRDHVSRPYKQKRVLKNFEPQSTFNPFSIFSDPLGLKKMSEHIPNVMETIGEKLPDSGERREFLDFLSGVKDKIPGIPAFRSDTLETASNLLSGFSSLSPSILVSIGAAWYSHNKTWISFAFFIGCVIYFIIKTPEQLGYLLKLYMNLFDKVPQCPDEDINMESVDPQFSDSNLELAGSAIATSLIGMVGMKSKMGAAALALAFAKDFSRARLGMIEISKLVISFVEKVVNLFRESCLNLPSIKFLDSCSKEIDEFSQEVRLISFQYNRGTLPINDSCYSKVSCLLDIGKHLIKTIPKDKFSEASLRFIQEDCNNLKRIVQFLEQNDVSLRGVRQEPCGILLSGGPGVAKSIAMLYAAYVLTKGVLNDEQKAEFDKCAAAFIYSRKIENVFWDGLSNQALTIIYDDFMQYRDATGGVSESMEIIRVINTEEYNAHMAHLENKGNVYIRPKFVIATTNQNELVSNTIINMDALKRRFDLSYVVVPKDEYVLDEDINKDNWHRRLDREKLPQADTNGLDDLFVSDSLVSDLRPEHLEYLEYDLVNKVYGKRVQYADVLKRAADIEFVKRKRFALHKDNFKKLVSKYSKIFDTKVECERLTDDYSFDPSTELDTESDSDEDDDVSFIDSVCATDDQRQHLEFLLVSNNVYRRYLLSRIKCRKGDFNQELISILLDNYGYHKASDMILNEHKVKDGAIKNKCKKLHVRVFDSISNVVNYFLSFLPEWKKVSQFICLNKDTIIMILGFLAGSSFLIAVAKWIYTWWTGKPAPQSFGFSDKLRSKEKGKVNPKFVRSAKEVHNFLNVVPQFGDDSSGLEMIVNVLRRNCFKFEVFTDEGRWNQLGTITFVVGRIGIIPYHFIVKILAGLEDDPTRRKRPIRLSHGNDKNDPGLLFTVEEVLNGHQTGCLVTKDLVLVEFPTRLPERVSILDRFALRKDLVNCRTNLDVLLPNTRLGGFYCGKGHRFNDLIGVKGKIPGYDYVIEESFTYDIPTQAGDCGSPMCVLNPSIQKRKIFGIHVAGNTYHGDGFSSVITQEELLEDLKLFDDPVVVLEPDLLVPQSGDLDSPLRFEIVGKSKLCPQRSSSTALCKSKMYGSLGPNGLSPAMLRSTLVDGIVIDPLLNAQMKYCKPDILFNIEDVQLCCKSYFAFCEWNEVHQVERRIYNTEEAIYGLEYDMDFGSINSSSSAGYPMNVVGQRNLKKELFSYDRGTVEHDSIFCEVEELSDEIIANAKQKKRMFHVFSDNLKDELREDHKVAVGSTRLFSGCPFSYFVAFRRYFGAFCLWYMKNRIGNGSFIGGNPYSTEWNSLAERLINKSPNNIGAGDHEKYDGSQKPVIHLLILDDINRWYNDGPVNNLIRSILWMEIYNSRHIVDGVIYEWLSALPSGHPFTIIINTIYNHIISRYVWLRSVGSLIEYDHETYVISVGDDITYSTTDEYTEKFNDIAFAKYAAELGMVYTNETKSGEMVARRSLTEIEFLKRSFVFDVREGVWIAPLRLQSILKMIDWTKRKHKNAIVASNVVVAIKELSLHERPVFEHYSEMIKVAFKTSYPYLHPAEPLDLDFWSRRAQVLNTMLFY